MSAKINKKNLTAIVFELKSYPFLTSDTIIVSKNKIKSSPPY